MAVDGAIWPETTAVGRLLVYGYLRTADVQPDAVVAYEAELAAWCEREGWQLGATFRDLGVEPDALIRPGFAAALDVLTLPESYALVVLDAGHLSSLGAVAKRLRSSVRRTGAKVLVRDQHGPPTGVRESDAGGMAYDSRLESATDDAGPADAT